MSIDLVPRTPNVSGYSADYPFPTDGGKEKMLVRVVDRIVKNSERNKDPLAKYKQVHKQDLVTYLNKLWNKARETRSSHDQEMLGDIDSRMGKYSKPELARIDRQGSPKIFMKITLEKCRALEAQLVDVYLSNVRKPWNITHSPEPEVPKKMRDKVIIMVEGVMQKYMQMGQMQEISKEAVMSFAGELMESAKRTLIEEFKKSAEVMEKLIDDRLLESDWRHAFGRFIYYFVTCKAGFLKGPIMRYKPVGQWKGGKRIVREKKIFDWEAPNPLDVYPSPDCRDPNQSFIFEKHRYSLNEMYAMRNIPGAMTKNICLLYTSPSPRDS